jgi:DNA-binding response OmpR family regulator
LRSGSGLILVIDDEEVVRETVAELLKAIGYQVLLAASGDEGVSAFKKEQKNILAVILDMAMPKKSGRDVFPELKEIDPGVRVVLCSGFRQDRRVKEVMNMGVDAFLQKPFSLEQLMTTLKKVLDS